MLLLHQKSFIRFYRTLLPFVDIRERERERERRRRRISIVNPSIKILPTYRASLKLIENHG